MKCLDSWGNRGSPLQEFTAAGNGEGRLYPMSAPATRKCKDFLVAKNSPKTTFKNRAKPPNYRRRIAKCVESDLSYLSVPKIPSWQGVPAIHLSISCRFGNIFSSLRIFSPIFLARYSATLRLPKLASRR
jgi:hypothetical protein